MSEIITLSDDEHFTRAQLRQKIAFILGRRQNPDSPLSVDVLNSAYAHMTGSFHTHPMWLDTGRSPGKARVRWAVILSLDRDGYDVSSYFPDPEHYVSQPGNRPLRRDELETLAIALKESDDQRSWLDQ